MNCRTTKYNILQALVTGELVHWIDGDPTRLLIAFGVLSIEREDGSGNSFNVTTQKRVFYVKTID